MYSDGVVNYNLRGSISIRKGITLSIQTAYVSCNADGTEGKCIAGDNATDTGGLYFFASESIQFRSVLDL